MPAFIGNLQRLVLAVAVGLSAAGGLSRRDRAAEPPFKYVGGTTLLAEPCKGKLELKPAAMVFDCPKGAITVPYASIRFMEYRPDISRKVRKLKPRWKVKPEVEVPLFGKKQNRYFTVVFDDHGATGALVLAVLPQAMRPYLAEIDLKAGQRVEVKGYEDYR